MSGENYTLTVQIADDQTLATLIESKLNLVILRDMEVDGQVQQGNVAFAVISSDNLANFMTVSWRENYQVFETAESLIPGRQVEPGTDTPDIRPNQTVTFTATGMSEVAENTGQPLSVVNDWRMGAHVGVRGYSALNSGFTPLYISGVRPLSATSKFNPVHSFSAFFSSTLKTGTMVDVITSPAARFTFQDGVTEGEISYQDRAQPFWTAVSGTQPY